jgi:hypothetical protein
VTLFTLAELAVFFSCGSAFASLAARSGAEEYLNTAIRIREKELVRACSGSRLFNPVPLACALSSRSPQFVCGSRAGRQYPNHHFLFWHTSTSCFYNCSAQGDDHTDIEQVLSKKANLFYRLSESSAWPTAVLAFGFVLLVFGLFVLLSHAVCSRRCLVLIAHLSRTERYDAALPLYERSLKIAVKHDG